MKQLPKTQFETERMLEVQLRLTQLFKKEEATVKAVLDCLYDVGSVNLIDKKVNPKPLQRALKPIARLSKPLFRAIAVRLFHANCPALITDWLYEQVLFEEIADETESTLAASLEPEPFDLESLAPPNALTQSALARLETQNLEIQKLHDRVRWLTGFSVAAIAIAAGLTLALLNPGIELEEWLPRSFTERSRVEPTPAQP